MMRELFKKKVTRKEFLKAGLAVGAAILITSILATLNPEANAGYGNGAYGG